MNPCLGLYDAVGGQLVEVAPPQVGPAADPVSRDKLSTDPPDQSINQLINQLTRDKLPTDQPDQSINQLINQLQNR